MSLGGWLKDVSWVNLSTGVTDEHLYKGCDEVREATPRGL